MNRLLRLYNAAESRSSTGPSWSFLPELGEIWWHAKHCGRTHGAVFDTKQHAKVGVANAHRFFQHRLKYRVQVARRRANDLEHVGGGSLLLKRFRQIVGALTQFVKQSRVLDGDDSLIGKIVDQFNLLVRKLTNFFAIDGNGADYFVRLEHRDRYNGADARDFDCGYWQYFAVEICPAFP